MEIICTKFAKGDVLISLDVIAKAAGIVASGCYGVVGMAYRSKKDEIANLLKKDNLAKGIKVYFEEDKLAIDMHIIVDYGVNINAVSTNVMSNVKYHITNITGMEVAKVDVFVEGFRLQNKE